MTNRERYKKVFDKAAASEMKRLEAEIVKKNHKNSWHAAPRAAAIALAALVSLGGIAYAAARYYGILDFTKGTSQAIQEEDGLLIEKELPQKTSGSQVVQIGDDDTEGKSPAREMNAPNDLFTCEVKEALRDSETITIVYEVSAKEPGKYLFVPEDADPKDGIPKMQGGRWDGSGEITIRDYAKQKKLTVVHIGGGIGNREELEVVESELDFRSPADDVMDIYVKSTLASSYTGQNVVCVATARSESEDRIVKEQIAFPLSDRSNAVVTEYIPAADDAYAESLESTFTKAEVIRTDLRTYVDVYFTRQREGLWEEEIVLKMEDSRGEQSGGFIVTTEKENEYKARIALGKMEVEDSFQVMISDIGNNKELLQTVTFERQ